MNTKVLNFIWVGDEKLRPDNFIETWKVFNPEWDIKVWGNKEYQEVNWETKKQMQQFWQDDQLCGVADLMRWEILHNYGGFTVDADFICINKLPDWFIDCNFLAVYENEKSREGLISNGFMGSVKNNAFIKLIIDELKSAKDITTKRSLFGLIKKKRSAWKTSGPRILTKYIHQTDCATILPSHFFLPHHFTDNKYKGFGPIYAYQMWGSTGTGSKGKSYSEYSTSELIDFAKESMAKYR